jgi:hypothetical protein
MQGAVGATDRFLQIFIGRQRRTLSHASSGEPSTRKNTRNAASTEAARTVTRRVMTQNAECALLGRRMPAESAAAAPGTEPVAGAGCDVADMSGGRLCSIRTVRGYDLSLYA